MNRSESSIYILSFLIIFLSLTFTSHNVSSSQILHIPQSEGEEKLARLLHEQIQANESDDFVKILDNYPQYINIVHYYPIYSDFLTPLHFAAVSGRDRFIDELLKRKADPSLPTLSRGNTILHLSPMPHITKRFIDLELDLEALNYQNMTPLLVQVFRKRLNREVIHTLLEAGVNVEAKTNGEGFTALHILFRPHHLNRNREDLLRVLQDILDHDGRVDARTKNGVTPLHFATGRNNIQAIQILIDKANQVEIEDFINIKDFEFGNTPLFIAYASRVKEAISLLLKLGANPLSLNKANRSVNGNAHLENERGSSFGKFILDEIAKHFIPSTHCAHSLMRKGL